MSNRNILIALAVVVVIAGGGYAMFKSDSAFFKGYMGSIPEEEEKRDMDRDIETEKELLRKRNEKPPLKVPRVLNDGNHSKECESLHKNFAEKYSKRDSDAFDYLSEIMKKCDTVVGCQEALDMADAMELANPKAYLPACQ